MTGTEVALLDVVPVAIISHNWCVQFCFFMCECIRFLWMRYTTTIIIIAAILAGSLL